MVLSGQFVVGTLKINGLLFIPDFISPEEEAQVICHLGEPIISPKRDQTTRNNILRYGSKTPYAMGNVSVEIPSYLQFLSDKIVSAQLSPMPHSVSVNEYLSGQKIDPHIDSERAGPIISIISLLSSAIMRFTKEDQVFDLELPPRSYVRMQDEVRYKWKHEILPVVDRRYSIVFRCS